MNKEFMLNWTGICIYINGDWNKGMWENSFKQGWGNLLLQNGNLYEGMWENDKWKWVRNLVFQQWRSLRRTVKKW